MDYLNTIELLDELPMIYGSCVFLYALNHHTYKPKSRNYSYVLLLLLYSVAVTCVYLYWKNPIFHQVCYAILVFSLMYEAVLACRNYPEIKPLVLASLVTYGSGFVVWNIDNYYCSSLREIRRGTQRPIMGPITQLHAWWHVLTGTGTYLHILFASYARTLHLKRKCSVKMLWRVWPYLQIGEKQ